jgi:hypothetical protein
MGSLSYESTPEPNPKGLRLKICREVCGSWSVYGLSLLPADQLPSLSDAIDYARQQCAAAPATIELLIGGFYAVIHQERGWPRRLLAREVDEKPPASSPTSLRAAPASSRLFGWLIGGAANRH